MRRFRAKERVNSDSLMNTFVGNGYQEMKKRSLSAYNDKLSLNNCTKTYKLRAFEKIDLLECDIWQFTKKIIELQKEADKCLGMREEGKIQLCAIPFLII